MYEEVVPWLLTGVASVVSWFASQYVQDKKYRRERGDSERDRYEAVIDRLQDRVDDLTDRRLEDALTIKDALHDAADTVSELVSQSKERMGRMEIRIDEIRNIQSAINARIEAFASSGNSPT